YLIDDDFETWKKDCDMILAEAKVENPTQPIYAYIWTNYYNRDTSYPFFSDAYKPIKEEIWLQMLEHLYYRCNGIVIASNTVAEKPVEWSEDLGLMKATKTFYERHKAIIDKEL